MSGKERHWGRGLEMGSLSTIWGQKMVSEWLRGRCWLSPGLGCLHWRQPETLVFPLSALQGSFVLLSQMKEQCHSGSSSPDTLLRGTSHQPLQRSKNYLAVATEGSD